MKRYSTILTKNKREIVLLRGNGCKWKRCRFCDYHLDYSNNVIENFNLNKSVLTNVNGTYGKLEVINSGSFVDLGDDVLDLIRETCISKNITTIYFECHWIHRNKVKIIKEYFLEKEITVYIKIGVESFDYNFRENLLVKGINEKDPAKIAKYFDEVCLLQGVKGQTLESMKEDIELGLKYFNRVCINIMMENSTPIKPDKSLINSFMKDIYPIYIDNNRVDILIENTDFGVGGN